MVQGVSVADPFGFGVKKAGPVLNISECVLAISIQQLVVFRAP